MAAKVEFVLFIFLPFFGCIRKIPPAISTVPDVSLPPPLLEKTFGEIQFPGSSERARIIYQDIVLELGPDSSLNGINPADYVLLTRLDRQQQNVASLSHEQKIILPAAYAKEFTERQFRQVKGLQQGQKILLKKERNFLFVTAVQFNDSAAHRIVNGYWLEFDNGRNVLISGGITDLSILRPFLYDLRDEGKEVHVLLLSGNSASFGEVIALFQPKLAVLQTPDKLDISKLKESLVDAFFQGAVTEASAEHSVSF